MDSTGASDSFYQRARLPSFERLSDWEAADIQIAIQAAGFSVSKEGVIDSLASSRHFEKLFLIKRTRSFCSS